MTHYFRIALAGNPNCGKTTIFNLLTGARQHVGNYPGVTVERKSGVLKIDELTLEVVDLPGVYSLSSSSPEERVAFQELLENPPDLIMNVVDASNPQRNLYLTTQLGELGIPLLLVFNMSDDARRRGLEINYGMLEAFFGARIVATVGSEGVGTEELRRTLHEMLTAAEPRRPVRLGFGERIDRAIAEITALVEKNPPPGRIPARYYAIKLLEGDATVCRLREFAALEPQVGACRERIAAHHGMHNDAFMADRRYGVIAGACREAISITNEKRRQLSDTIDRVAVSRFLGLPIFLGVMYLVFMFTFVGAEPLMAGLELFFEKLAQSINAAWPAGQADFLRRLLTEGIIGGVGGVLVFLPNILLLFLAIAFLEGTGYMARAAFVMDGFMHKFGLHGKSFIPMLLGFGCTVPAVMATRTIESTRDRLATIMVLPLMSCGARLPIYALFIPAFFPARYQALTLWVIYLIGVVTALVLAGFLKRTIFKGGDEVFVMELPPYRMPTLRGLLLHMWERTVLYLNKAGTIILGASILLFIINTWPVKRDLSCDYAREIIRIEQADSAPELRHARIEMLNARRQAELLEYSIAGRVGKTLAVVTAPLGFDWRVSSALVGAFAAKELFVSQLGILYSGAVGSDGAPLPLREELRKHYTPLQAFAIMLFCLLAMPCVATVAVVRRESGSWKLTLLQLAGLTLLAYAATLVVYQAGLFLNLGTKLF